IGLGAGARARPRNNRASRFRHRLFRAIFRRWSLRRRSRVVTCRLPRPGRFAHDCASQTVRVPTAWAARLLSLPQLCDARPMSDVAPGGVNLAVDPDVAPYVAQGTDPPRSLWPQFAHRKPGGEAISAHGAQVAGCADVIDEVNRSAESLHARARSQVHGDPAGPMAAATHDVTRRADLLQRRAVVAGGAITEFGQAVSEFNQLVDGWNAQIQCRSEEHTSE